MIYSRFTLEQETKILLFYAWLNEQHTNVDELELPDMRKAKKRYKKRKKHMKQSFALIVDIAMVSGMLMGLANATIIPGLTPILAMGALALISLSFVHALWQYKICYDAKRRLHSIENNKQPLFFSRARPESPDLFPITSTFTANTTLQY